ncbi:MAG: pitrilysin family protein [Smithellaceae bacterium]|nr:pitrilysin family protein [Smithellaceae bacterium]
MKSNWTNVISHYLFLHSPLSGLLQAYFVRIMTGRILPGPLTCLIIALMMFLHCGIFPSRSMSAQPFPMPDNIKYPRLEFRLQQAERVDLKNGMILFYLQDSELPLVSISALVRTGSMYDPPGKEGLAELTAYLMRTGGTEKFSSDEIDERLDALAASPSLSMSLDSASVTFSFLKDDLDACLDLLAQIIRKPAFEEKKIQLALSLKNEELRRTSDNPQKLAFREFNRLLYPDDPRGRYMTTGSLENIRRDDLIDFHRSYFFPSNTMIAVTGDISKEEAVKKIMQYFGRWGQVRHAVNPAPPPKKTTPGVFYIHKQLTQSTVVSGEFTVSKNDPDYYPFSVLDFIVGSGGFRSRIFSAVRNHEGLAYSAGSFYRARSSYGIFGTYAFTKTTTTLQSLYLINDILRNTAAGSIKPDELEWAKKSILNNFIFSFELPHQIAVQQMLVEYEKLPADYLISYRKKIEAVTGKDVKRVAATYLNEKRRLMLILGNTDQFGKLPEKWGQPVLILPNL